MGDLTVTGNTEKRFPVFGENTIQANRICWLYRSTLVEVMWTISSANWPLGSGITGLYKNIGNHTYLGLRNNRGMQSKNGLQNVWGNIYSLFSVTEIDVIVHKKYFPCITLLNFGHSVPHFTSEPGGWGGTRHSHQILLQSSALFDDKRATISPVVKLHDAWKDESILSWLIMNHFL